MKIKTLYVLWGCLFILCAVLGFIPEPTGFLRGLMICLAAAFFIPGWVLLGRGSHVRVVLWLSVTSLVATLILLVLNFLSIGGNSAAGEMLYGLLVVFSAPMICGQYWAASLFLWACLMVASLSRLRKPKQS